jgi:tetratricopeptide (TPR) repeat protein
MQIEVLKKAIKIKPDLAEAYCIIGVTYYHVNDKHSALEEYKILKNLNPNLANRLFNLIRK